MKKITAIFGLLSLGSSAVAHADTTPADCQGAVLVPTGYVLMENSRDCDYGEGLSPVMNVNSKKYGYADRAGKLVISPIFEEAHGFDEGLALVRQDGKYGFITPSSGFAILPYFYDAWSFLDGRAKVQFGKEGKFGFIDKSGKLVVPAIYDATGSHWFYDGRAAVKRGEKWGYIDKNGKQVIDFDYDFAEPYSEGLAAAGHKDKNGKPLFGYIDTNNQTVIAPKYSYASPFIDGVAIVIENDELLYINKKGQKVKADDKHNP